MRKIPYDFCACRKLKIKSKNFMLTPLLNTFDCTQMCRLCFKWQIYICEKSYNSKKKMFVHFPRASIKVKFTAGLVQTFADQRRQFSLFHFFFHLNVFVCCWHSKFYDETFSCLIYSA